MTIKEAKEQLLKHKKEIDQKYISARYSKAIETALKELEKQDTEINKLNKEKEYYKKLYNESYNFLDPKFTGDHIPRID